MNNELYANETLFNNMKTMTTTELVCYLRQIELLCHFQKCDYCNQIMAQHNSTRHMDGMIFKCKYKECNKKSTTKSIRVGSFFSDCNLELIKIMEYVYHYSNNSKCNEICGKLNISHPTARRINLKLSKLILRYFERNPIRLGGHGVICQVDETKLSGKRKYNVGTVVSDQTWVLCIVDTSYKPSLGFAKVVSDRSATCRLPIIKSVCLPGTIIHTDQWRSYKDLGKTFEHQTVNHKVNFINPITGAHTQNVESYNNKLKYRIKEMRGIKKELIDDYLLEFNYRERFTNVYLSFLKEMKIL